jgi:hypothetical protein
MLCNISDHVQYSKHCACTARKKLKNLNNVIIQVLFCGVRCCSSVTYGTIACRQVSRPIADEFEGRLCQTISFYHKVLIYREHHSVCTLVGTGTPPTPLPQANVPSPPPRTKEWGAHSSAAKRVGESQFRRLEKKLSTLPTL